MDESTRIRIARARALSSNRYTAGISVPSDVVMERRVGSQANFFNGALVGPCCVNGTAAEQEAYILRLQLNDRVGRSRDTTLFTVAYYLDIDTMELQLTPQQLKDGVLISDKGKIITGPARPAAAGTVSAVKSVAISGPGSLFVDIGPGAIIGELSLTSTDFNVGDAGDLNITNSSITSVSMKGYYASGNVTVGPSVTILDVAQLTGGILVIRSPSTVTSLTLVNTTLANPPAVAAGLYTGATAGTLSFFAVDANTGINPFVVTSISAAVTVIDAPGVAPTVTDVSDMSMVQLSYDGAVPSGFDLEYWLGVTPDFTDVSAGTFIPGGEAPFTPLSQTNYYFKCRFVRGSPYLASELSPASGLYFMPKAPNYTATHTAVTLTYTETNTPPGATTLFFYGESASHSGLTQLPSNVYTYSGPISPALYFFCKLVLADSSSTVISPATGPVLRPAP